MHYQLTLKNLTDSSAILVNKTGQEFVWPINQLPQNSQVGQIFNCVLVNPVSLEDDDQAIAKSILNELLKIS
ncbi:MAG TPA: hypothetical protein PKN62_03095 [bacterium]|nr:hypothetical protein [bacterium]